MEEFKARISEHITEEQNDMDAYCKLAEHAEKLGKHDIAGILKDIAHEEKSHKTFLEEILSDM